MSTPRFAVIGNPISHSLSPEIHLAFGKQLGVGLSYEKLQADDDQFGLAAREFFSTTGVGLNVTAPFKGDAHRFADELDRASTDSGAVNTIHNVGDLFFGYNTDGVGLLRDLKRLQWDVSQANVLILGAGGATQGILTPLIDAEAQITVANRTFSRAEALQNRWSSLTVSPLDKLGDRWDMVINATSVSWQDNQLSVSDQVFTGAKCYDLAYQRDGSTTFTRRVEPMASDCSDGLGMLVEQAAVSFQIWHGVTPDTTQILQALRKPTRRFIADAVCPRCHAKDTIYVEFNLQHEATHKVCTACGYQEDKDGNVVVQIK